MFKYVSFFLVIVSLCSCKGVWDEDDKKLYIKTCMDDAIKWAGNNTNAATYCNCVLEKMIQKYPSESDALENIDSIKKDPSIIACKNQVLMQK